MLTKEVVLDKIEITETGAIQVRRATYILEDGKRIAGPTYHRSAYEPGRDVAAEAPLVRNVAALVWTPEVLTAHVARVATNQGIVPNGPSR